MKTLLTEIELDVQELKCFIDAISRDSNPTLLLVAKRHILNMHSQLDHLLKEVEALSVGETEAKKTEPMVIQELDIPNERPIGADSVNMEKVLGERIRTGIDLRRSLSLNDSFRFSRDLFNDDSDRMNRVLQQAGEMSSLKNALTYLVAELKVDQENETWLDLKVYVEKFF